jgi:hypothetical protein
MVQPSQPTGQEDSGGAIGFPAVVPPPAVLPPVVPPASPSEGVAAPGPAYGGPSAPAAVATAAVATAAEDQQLGRLLEVFAPKRHSSWIVIPMLVVSIALIWCIFPIYVLWLLFRTPNLNRKRAAQRLYVYERGLVLATRPDQPDVWRWNDIHSIFQKAVVKNTLGVTTGATVRYTINRTDGAFFTLTHFWTDSERLGHHVSVQVTAALLPPMRRAISSGQGVQFGEITIDRNGVTSRLGSATWSEITSIEFVGGHLRMKLPGKFIPLTLTPAHKIPNLILLVALTNELRGS